MTHTKESVTAYFDYLISILEKAKEPFAEFYTRPEFQEEDCLPQHFRFDYAEGWKEFNDKTGELEYSEPDLLYWGLYSASEMHSLNLETGEIKFDESVFEDDEEEITENIWEVEITL
jgi:hypothetical protein